jgi:CheY-like chemotaxis protein
MSVHRVLHVDDEADIREVVEIALGLDSDLATRSCASGEEALATAAAWSPHIILLDVMMPAMDGPATLKRLRERRETAEIPVVFMTARAQSREIESFKSLGAVGVIPKPFDPMTLAALVCTHLKPRENRLDEMRDSFLLRVDRDIIKLGGHWSAMTGSSAVAGIEGIRAVAHGLAGTGGVFGFDEISVAAARLEEAVLFNRDGSGSKDEIYQALNHLKACAGKSEGGNDKRRVNS